MEIEKMRQDALRIGIEEGYKKEDVERLLSTEFGSLVTIAAVFGVPQTKFNEMVRDSFKDCREKYDAGGIEALFPEKHLVKTENEKEV